MAFINNLDKYYGHTNDEKIEYLKEHMSLSKEYAEKVIKSKNLDETFDKLYKNLIGQDGYEDLFKELILLAIELHDIGKINRNYQAITLKNRNFKSVNSNTDHSKVGSILYIDYVYSKLKNIDKKVRKRFLVLVFINAYMISKHHGKLSSFGSYLKSFNIDNELIKEEIGEEYSDYDGVIIGKKAIEEVEQIFNNRAELVEKEIKHIPSIEQYIYSKLVYSLITASDFYATADFNEVKINDFGYIEDINKYYDKFKESRIFEGVGKLKSGDTSYFKDTPINQLRTELFIESENNLVKNKYKNIYYLEAPTGSGKTVCSLNLALKSIELNKKLNKIFYIFPFNTLVDQTNNSLIDYLKVPEDIAIVNSITPIKENNESYGIDLLDRQFLHYPITLTSHVNFFNILFGVGREETFPLVHLANSVIILDEIQSYKNIIWKEIIMFLEKFADILNLKIIIMSATLPNLELLGVETDKCTYLINERDKYFKNTIFKNRVQVKYNLLDSDIEDTVADLEEFILSATENKILVEFLTVDSATEFYKSLKNQGISYVELITGNDNKAERQRIINKIKKINNEKVILVATQVVEAGVDIDMDLGFKDISILDSEEQFLGRINRSCKKKGCKVYFFNKDDEKCIYKEDFRKFYTLVDEENRNILSDKAFNIYYKKIIEYIENYRSGRGERSMISFINNEVGKLEFNNVKEHMKLIDQKKLTLFLNTEVTLANGDVVNGETVWDEYKRLLKSNIEYAQKRIELSRLSEVMDYFTYQVDMSYKKYIDGDIVGNMVYIGDGEKYLTEEGKFDKSLLKGSGYDIY